MGDCYKNNPLWGGYEKGPSNVRVDTPIFVYRSAPMGHGRLLLRKLGWEHG
jgi:hypothetical protein